MQFEYTPYILPLVISSIVAGFVAVYVWQRRITASGAMALVVLALASAEWSLGYALEIAGADLLTKTFWGKSQYIGICTVPLAWVIFAHSHSTPSFRVTRRTMALLSMLPFVTLLLAFTTELHGLIWKDIRIHAVGTFSVLDVTHGVWFWIYWGYSNVLLLVGTIFILQAFNRMKGVFRRQNFVLLIAVLTPWFGNVLYVLGLSPIPNLDITPFAFTISVVVFAWGILSFKLVNLAPLARDLVVEKMPDGMFVLDSQGTILDINLALQNALGVSASQAIGQRAKDLFNAWPFLVERYENMLEAEDEVVFGEGESQRWYELRMAPLVDSRNALLGRVVTVRDISERKQAEEHIRKMNVELERRVRERTSQLEESNTYLTTLIETSIALNKSLDLNEVLDRILLQANKLVPARALNIMFVEGEYAFIVRRIGYQGLEKIERNLLDFRFPISWPTFQQMCSTRKSMHISDTAENPGWQTIQGLEWVRSYIGVPLVISDETVGFLNASHSEPNFFDEKHRTMLESLARHASIAIQNARLLEELKSTLEKEQGMRDQLVQADKLAALGKMVSAIAHEINNPIQTVKNTFYLLEDQLEADSPASEYLKMASEEANRISDLVSHLRGTYAPGSKEIVRVDVPALLVEVRDLLAPQLKKRRVEWCQSDALQSYQVNGIRNNLKQVFINLCLNAMEAMEENQGGTVTVSLRTNPDGQRVGVDFHNTGPQISKEVLPYIFEPFFTTKRNGTGLGLSISYDIIRQHQGEIRVENGDGQGVTFTVWLPLAPDERDGEEP